MEHATPSDGGGAGSQSQSHESRPERVVLAVQHERGARSEHADASTDDGPWPRPLPAAGCGFASIDAPDLSVPGSYAAAATAPSHGERVVAAQDAHDDPELSRPHRGRPRERGAERVPLIACQRPVDGS